MDKTKEIKVEGFNVSQLSKDVDEIVKLCKKKGYLIHEYDYFALGYLCGTEGLDRIIDNRKAIIEAIESYDLRDELTLFDTIGEVLVDLEII